MSKYFVLSLAACLSCASSASYAVRLSVASQPMEGALRQFVEQSGIQVLYPSDMDVLSAQSGGVEGDLSVERGLAAILASSKLRFEFLNANTAVIRVAENPSSITDPAPAQNSSKTEIAADGRTLPSDHRGIPEVLVRGARSSNADIQRTEDDVQPYVVIGREEISNSQAASVEEFLKTRLSMNAASTSIEQGDLAYINSGGINLRGLGANQTLILVDGRRQAGVSMITGELGQPDISGIPLSTVERIEVLPTTASGIYGGSATGGVINIIRKKDYTGFGFEGKYGNTFDSQSKTVDGSVNWGSIFNEGRTSASLAMSYSKSDPLMASNRDFAVRARQRMLANSPDLLLGGLVAPITNTTNVCRALLPTVPVCSKSPLTLDSGQSLGSAITYVPSGYAGPASDGGAALLSNAGQYNLSTPEDDQVLLRAPVRRSVVASVRHQFSSMFDAFLDLSGNRSDADLSSSSSVLRGVTLAGNSPDNPFREAIVVRAYVPSLRLPARSENSSLQASAGVIAKLSNDWAATVERSWGRSSSKYSQTSRAGLTPAGISALASASLRDLQDYPIDLSAYELAAYNQAGGPFRNTLESTSLRIAGPTFRLPTGPMVLTALVERRTERADDAFATDPAQVTLYPARSQNVDSAYVEARVPLAGQTWNIPLLQELEFQAAVRRDQYKTVSTSTTPSAPTLAGPFATPSYFSNRVSSTDFTLGLKYSPIRSVTFRASLGTGFLPPGLSQIMPLSNTSTFSYGVTDPKRGNTDTYVGRPFVNIVAGNPDLDPERSRSWSAGFVVAPEAAKWVRFSADYTRIRKTDEIYQPLFAFIVQNEDVFPGRVVRGTNIPGDQPGWAGPITSVDSTNLNFSESEISALDLRAEFNADMGRFGRIQFSSMATNARRFLRQVTDVSSAYDSVGKADGPLKWKGQTFLAWQSGRWGVSWASQFYGSYSIDFSNPSLAATNAVLERAQGASTIPSQNYHDVVATFKFRHEDLALIEDLSLSISVQNVFNTHPPVVVPQPAVAAGSGPYGYSTYADPRLRRYVIGLQAQF